MSERSTDSAGYIVAMLVAHIGGYLTLHTIWDAAFATVNPLDGPEQFLTIATLLTMGFIGFFAAVAATYGLVRHSRLIVAMPVIALLCFPSMYLSVAYVQTALIFTGGY